MAPNFSSNEVFSFEKKKYEKKKRDSDLFINARISKDNSLIYSNKLLFVVPKYLNLPSPKFEYEVQASYEKVYIQIKAISFIYQLYIVCNNSEGVFSNNYFI